MSGYNSLFARTNFSSASASAVTLGSFETEIVSTNLLLAGLETLDNSAEVLLQQSDALDSVITVFEGSSETEKPIASKMLFAMVNGLSGNQLAEAGFSQESFDWSMEALDSVKNAVSRGFDVVIETIEKMITEFRAFIATFFDKFPGLSKAAEALKEKAGKTDGSAEKSKIKIGSAYAALCGGDKEIGDIVKGLETIIELREKSGIDKVAAFIGETLTDKLGGSVEDVKGIKGTDIINKDHPFAAFKYPLLNSPKAKALKTDGLQVKGIEDLLGDKTFACTYRKVGEADLEGALSRLASLKMGFFDQTEKLDVSDKEAPVLNQGTVERICDAVVKVADTYEKSKDEVRDGIKQQEKMVALLKKVKANVDKSDYKEVKGVLNRAKAAVQNLARFATAPAAQIAGYAYVTANAALSYGEKSLAQYK